MTGFWDPWSWRGRDCYRMHAVCRYLLNLFVSMCRYLLKVRGTYGLNLILCVGESDPQGPRNSSVKGIIEDHINFYASTYVSKYNRYKMTMNAEFPHGGGWYWFTFDIGIGSFPIPISNFSIFRLD